MGKTPVKSLTLSPEVIPSVSEGGSALQNYMARISQIPLLTREEEHQLAVAYFETKDPLAGKQLIQSNLRFVVKVAAEYSRFSSKVMDLIQEGNIGLIRAVQEFNPYKGARLIHLCGMVDTGLYPGVFDETSFYCSAGYK